SVDGTNMLIPFHNRLDAFGGVHPGDLGDWEKGGDAFGYGDFNTIGVLSQVDLRVLDVLGWTPSGAAPPPVADDFANSLTDATHPFGQVTVGGSSSGTIDFNGDRDWFRVQLTGGTTYTINLQGQHAGAGTLEDPYLRVHNSTGALLAENDDIVLGTNRDSQLTFQVAVTGTYYLEAGAFDDNYVGTYRVSVGTTTITDDFRD